MAKLRRLRGRVLWIPVGAVAAVGALLAGTMFASAAAPNLPKKSAAQLLAAMSHARLPRALTAVISESANLGFPALPDIAGLPSSALSAASWLAGTHTVQVWYSGPQHIRIAVPVPFGETDLRVNGKQVWLWQSHGQIATHIILAQPTGPSAPLWRISHLRPAQIAHVPAFLQQRVPVGTGPVGLPTKVRLSFQKLRSAQAIGVHLSGVCRMRVWRVAGGPEVPSRIIRQIKVRLAPIRLHGIMKMSKMRLWGHPNVRIARIKQVIAQSHLSVAPPAVGVLKAISPLQAAQRLLAMIGPSTKVTVAGTTTVAGRSAYQLSIEPRSNQSLIGQILIAVDSQTYLPLQVQVIPRGSSSPAFQVGFTTFTPGQPAASNFTFTPPPGAHVHVVKLPNPAVGLPGFAGPGAFGVIPGASFGQVGVQKLAPPQYMIIKPIDVRNRFARVSANPVGPALCLPRLPGSLPTVLPPSALNAGPRVFGRGWLSVLEIPAGPALAGLSAGKTPTPGATGSGSSAYGSRLTIKGPAAQKIAWLRLLLNSATKVHGAWGSGKLISTRLLNILITSKGQVLIGAVTPAVLYADAAQVK